MTRYVNGFLISSDRTKVALIKKNRPDWQAGKLNGIGGHIEGVEMPESAMTREFEEETGVERHLINWKWFCIFSGDNYQVYWFKAFGDYEITTITDEEVSWYLIEDVISNKLNIIPNIRWILLLALDLDNVTAEIEDRH